ncbi:circadian clock protein KaiC [Rhizobium sp. G21]|uniref:circadian clock protein KaiC n=1 Tax=Rhizobium sp. G21 TaxID=2758439 RepID=UPI0016031E29|nr:circadian clock protein KaiC [Rhizobium sp. G21]MBB1251409.1 circadian clock protein KaiC [Rhizobium sp. G21]
MNARHHRNDRSFRDIGRQPQGGTGKTTTAVNLAAGFARSGLRSLLIDFDTQGHSGLAFGAVAGRGEPTAHAVFSNGPEALQASIRMQTARRDWPDIAPADIGSTHPGGNVSPDLLARALTTPRMREAYDVVVIDTPPSLDALMVTALAASNAVIVPFVPHPLAIEGVRQFSRVFLSVRLGAMQRLHHVALLPVMANPTVLVHRRMIETLRHDFGERRILDPIRSDIRLAEAFAAGQPIYDYMPSGRGAQDYAALTHSILGRWFPHQTSPGGEMHLISKEQSMTDNVMDSVGKSATGIFGLDGVMRGGLPTGRTTLIEGGPGSGKTVLALQTLVNGAKLCGEPGIFVAFEESSQRILANANSFGWDLAELQRENLFFIDAQPSYELLQSGRFDLGGMLAALEIKVKELGAKRVVFDAIDMVLDLFENRQLARRETYRLHEWLNDHGLTALITAKASPLAAGATSEALEFLQFMVDCSIFLRHDMIESTSQRNIRIGKFRGSSFEENATPFGIGPQGIEVAFGNEARSQRPKASTERMSSGVDRLDTMLDGGYYRGAGILLTGSPGTAKTTLAGAFAVSACSRGERTLFVTLDSPEEEVVRNLAAVNLDLDSHLKSGVLLFKTSRSTTASAEIHLMRIRELAHKHQARCVVVDPISALSKSGNSGTARNVIERLIDWSKAEGITLVCTSLLEGDNPLSEGTAAQISTLADTWIHLNYLVHAGERNRALSIIKSRGSNHSNQVRELVLSASGISLADVYTAGGEVLMGALRWEKESADRQAKIERKAMLQRKSNALSTETVILQSQIDALQQQLAGKKKTLHS